MHVYLFHCKPPKCFDSHKIEMVAMEKRMQSKGISIMTVGLVFLMLD